MWKWMVSNVWIWMSRQEEEANRLFLQYDLYSFAPWRRDVQIT